MTHQLTTAVCGLLSVCGRLLRPAGWQRMAAEGQEDTLKAAWRAEEEEDKTGVALPPETQVGRQAHMQAGQHHHQQDEDEANQPGPASPAMREDADAAAGGGGGGWVRSCTSG